MLERMVVGTVPRKHHIALRDDQGNLFYEECLTQEGFEGPYTIVYHQRPPHTQTLAPVKHGWELPVAADARPLAKRHYQTAEMPAAGGAAIDRRVPLLFNDDVTLSVVKPSEPDPVYFANGDADELFYVHQG